MQGVCLPRKNFYNLLTLGFASYTNCGNKSEDESRGSTARGGCKTSGKRAEKSALVNGFSDSLGNKISESRKRNGCARAPEIRNIFY